jgi:hypothetical protein
VSVRFKNDRLFVFGSEAAPVLRPLPLPALLPVDAERVAADWIRELHQTVTLREGATPVALPLVGSGRVELRSAFRVMIEASSPPGRYAVYVDAQSGAPLAREQLLRFASAEVLFDAPVRGPEGERKSYPARLLNLTVDGLNVQTDAGGMLTWEGGEGAVELGAHGARIYVASQDGADASTMVDAVDGAPIHWSLGSDERGDAQLASYVHGNLVKAHALAMAPSLSFVKSQLSTRVNKQDPQGCNAFWDGSSVNFMLANSSCHNSARIADVVYHEFGHGLHQFAVIVGVGALDPSLGEGTGDIMSATVTHDPKLGPGFFVGTDWPLREMDTGRRWPDDIHVDPHETGLIWAGAMWDLRTHLVAELGEEPGHALTDQLFYQAIRRSSNIPSTYAEVLAADDDDGDLSNGTPHVCAINRAFLAHGLASVLDESGLTLHHQAVSLLPRGAGPTPIEVSAERLYPQCAATPIDHVDLRYRVGAVGKVIELQGDGELFKGQIPEQPAGTSLHYAILASAGGYETSLPDNRADDMYSVFVGTTKTLYCNDFETEIDGWTFGDAKGKKGDFQWGTPAGKGSDPTAAYSGKMVIGNRLNGDASYKRSQTVFAESPVIDRAGHERVRLQLRRWLAVEDGAFDQATIYVNGLMVWQNEGTDETDGSLTHRDREWRFVDLDLTQTLGSATTIQLRFELASDQQVQLGGWSLDDVCVVSWEPPPPSYPIVSTLQRPEDEANEELVARGAWACALGEQAPGRFGPFVAALGAALLALRRRRRG